MRCKWSKKQLLELQKKAAILNDIDTLEDISMMFDILNESINLDNFNIVPELEEVNFDDAYNCFSYQMNNLPEKVFDYLMELYKTEPDFDYFLSRPSLTRFNISNKDLITLGHDCLKELHDKKLVDRYDEQVKDSNRLLHISSRQNPTGEIAQLDGATFFDFVNKQNYIYVYNTNTAFKFQTLIHEAMHAHFYDLNAPTRGSIKYFQELEGRFGNLLASIYLKKIGFEKLYNELMSYELRASFHDSYNLYLNDLLFGLSKHKKFNLKKVKEVYEQENNDKWLYEPDDLTEICSIYGFDVATDLLCYLMTMETYSKHHDIEEVYHKTVEMKSADDFDSVASLEDFGYKFMNNNFKSVNKLRLQLKKEGF